MFVQLNMIRAVADSAMNKLRQTRIPENGAIIFDIDDTLIKSSGGLIGPIKSLYDLASRIGLVLFIVTNRVGTKSNIKETHAELSRYGITGYNTAYFRDQECDDMWHPKKSARKNIRDRGYKTVMSVGDKPWDVGEYGGIGVIVPS